LKQGSEPVRESLAELTPNVACGRDTQRMVRGHHHTVVSATAIIGEG